MTEIRLKIAKFLDMLQGQKDNFRAILEQTYIIKTIVELEINLIFITMKGRPTSEEVFATIFKEEANQTKERFNK